MYRIEYEQLLKNIGLYNPIRREKTTRSEYSTEMVHRWNGNDIWYDGFTIIKGKIPLEIARILHKEYPDFPYIYELPSSKGNLYNPDDEAVDAIYEYEMEKLFEANLDDEKYEKLEKAARRRLKKRVDKNKYLTHYEIDKKECLLLFFLLMKDYTLRKNNMPETEMIKYKDILRQTDIDVIKSINPTISLFDWMQTSKDYRDAYNKSNEIINNNDYSRIIKELLNEYDKAAIPFSDESDIDDLHNLDYLYTCGRLYNHWDIKKKGHINDCCYLEICPLENKENFVKYIRDENGLKIMLFYELDNGAKLRFTHYYDNYVLPTEFRGEKIEIDCHNNGKSEPIDLIFNVTNGTVMFRRDNCEIVKATIKDYAFIADKIKIATKLAKGIMQDNINGYTNMKKIK